MTIIEVAMEKYTEPVTSDSELEEGEIASDEIEIISEFINTKSVKRRPPPVKVAKDPPKRPRVSSPDRTTSGKSNGKSETSVRHSSKSSSRESSVKSTSKSCVRSNVRTSNASSPKNPRSSSNSRVRAAPLKLDDKRIIRSSPRKPSPRSPKSAPPKRRIESKSTDSKRTSSVKVQSPPQQVKKAVPVVKSVSPDNKWKKTFEEVSLCSVESMSIDSPSEDEDEVIELRLAALNSLNLVVTDLESKETADLPPAIKTTESLPSPEISEEKDEEDEDEQLLRARLLIEVSRKQTKELELAEQPVLGAEAAEKEKPSTDSRPIDPKPFVELKPLVIKKKMLPKQIPTAERLVINLQDDSSDSDSCDGFEDSLTALLKSARQTVESKTKPALPRVLSHLPRNQQEEYQRLKQEIVRRENNRHLKQGSKPVSSPQPEVTPNGTTETQLASENVIPPPEESKVVSLANAVDHQPLDSPRVNHVIPTEAESLPPISPVVSTTSCNSSTNSPSIASPKVPLVTMVASLANMEAPAKKVEPISPRLSLMKQQLIRKKRDLAQTKGEIKTQLEMVDKHRIIWMKSSQEVARLKSLLQQAEESELTLRNQLTQSQLKTQKLKARMQQDEKTIGILQSGLGVNRVRKNSAKTKPSPPKNGAVKPVVLPSTPFRVKPNVFAKAIAKTNPLKYVRPTGSNTESVEQLLPVKASAVTKPLTGRKTVHGENWLFGTLGDEWIKASEKDAFPAWSTYGHASKSLSNGRFPLDPSRTVCRNDLDSTCQDMSCPFQHLPRAQTIL